MHVQKSFTKAKHTSARFIGINSLKFHRCREKMFLLARIATINKSKKIVGKKQIAKVRTPSDIICLCQFKRHLAGIDCYRLVWLRYWDIGSWCDGYRSCAVAGSVCSNRKLVGDWISVVSHENDKRYERAITKKKKRLGFTKNTLLSLTMITIFIQMHYN